MLNTAPAPLTLVDLLPRWRARTGTLVVAFALLTAAAAQLSFHVPWTPVPITGQTFAVLVAGAVLGRSAGAASQGLYVALGAVGLPFYSGGDGGWEAATGATGGYLIGFVVAAFVTGALAERGQDRLLATSIPAMLAGSAVIYACGVSWLAWKLDVGIAEAVELGYTPFVIGDAIKLVAAGAVLPLAWRVCK
jgi:biotin transport system substrate-specific component